jgi:hypothetical protein
MGNIIMTCPKGFELKPKGCTVKCAENKGFSFVEEGDEYKCVRGNTSVVLKPLFPIPIEKGKEDITVETLKQWKNPSYDSYKEEQQRVESIFNRTNDPTVKSLLTKLKPFRPPTAPDSDIEKERKAIIKQVSVSLVVAQVALFSLVLSLIIYIFVPSSYAHLLVFLILSVAIALVFFLKK